MSFDDFDDFNDFERWDYFYGDDEPPASRRTERDKFYGSYGRPSKESKRLRQQQRCDTAYGMIGCLLIALAVCLLLYIIW